MKPVDFLQTNRIFRYGNLFGNKKEVPVRRVMINGGPLDNRVLTTVAWEPDASDLELLKAGGPVYISFIENDGKEKLPAHIVHCNFEDAVNLEG